jgi:hypothetical protein
MGEFLSSYIQDPISKNNVGGEGGLAVPTGVPFLFPYKILYIHSNIPPYTPEP